MSTNKSYVLPLRTFVMAGCLIPRTPLAVDFWKRRDIHQAKLFFLSHMHSDHTEGLSSSWDHKIYCSEITKSLAIAKLNINPSLLVVLPTGQSTILDLDETGVEKLTVTPIDANHCPGAVMFLFEGYFGRILYTGDFRYFEGMLDLFPLNRNPSINTLYLDNTYCDPKCDFPTKAEATLMIMDILCKHPSEDVVFGMHSLGKEDLLYKIALVLGVRIVVDEFRFLAAKLMGISSVFTTDWTASRVRVVRKCQVNKWTVSQWNEERPTIAIMPTCLYEGTHNPYADCERLFFVPYSDHSSFSELKKFVAGVKPQQIIPIVKKPNRDTSDGANTRLNMSIFAEQRSDDSLPQVFQIPKSVLAFMSQSTASTRTFPGMNKKRKLLSFFNNKPKKPCGIIFLSPQKERVCVKAREEVMESEGIALKEHSSDLDLDVASSNFISGEMTENQLDTPDDIDQVNQREMSNNNNEMAEHPVQADETECMCGVEMSEGQIETQKDSDEAECTCGLEMSAGQDKNQKASGEDGEAHVAHDSEKDDNEKAHGKAFLEEANQTCLPKIPICPENLGVQEESHPNKICDHPGSVHEEQSEIQAEEMCNRESIQEDFDVNEIEGYAEALCTDGGEMSVNDKSGGEREILGEQGQRQASDCGSQVIPFEKQGETQVELRQCLKVVSPEEVGELCSNVMDVTQGEPIGTESNESREMLHKATREVHLLETHKSLEVEGGILGVGTCPETSYLKQSANDPAGRGINPEVLPPEEKEIYLRKIASDNFEETCHELIQEALAAEKHSYCEGKRVRIPGTETCDSQEASHLEQIVVCPTKANVSQELSNVEHRGMTEMLVSHVPVSEKHIVEADADSTRYCIQQSKVQKCLNPYGGSCAFALKVLKKLKAEQQSK